MYLRALRVVAFPHQVRGATFVPWAFNGPPHWTSHSTNWCRPKEDFLGSSFPDFSLFVALIKTLPEQDADALTLSIAMRESCTLTHSSAPVGIKGGVLALVVVGIQPHTH